MTTLQAVELGVLGPLQVRQGGAPVAIPGAKPRAVLTMLGLRHGSVVSADTLVELLWGEDPPRTAAKALQTHISSLRRALGDGFVLTQGTGWALAESEVDASRYKSAARLGRDATATGDTGQAVARFEEALALWRGTPELPDGRRGTSEKTRWIEGHAALVEDRADALLATARAAEIIGELEAAVAEAPLRERRWGQLMLALYRAGRQGDALGAYQRARTMLADELGIDPGPELRRLEAAIVGQDASLDVVVAQNLPSVMRAVTFLLTDIEGSTAAWEADADAMAVALARHDELAEQVVTSRGGRLIKTRGEGDATFSVFERPSAAAAAAMELQDAIGREPWNLREPMRIRIALHTGEVELRDGDYFGRAVNRAARLRSLAAGGQILCSGATAELVVDSLPDDVVLADLGLRELRNLARPEHVFELRLETAEEGAEQTASEPPMERPGLPSVLIGTGPFVGRGSELERLLSAWQTSLGGGACAALIAGEPGVGKTRLAGEWSRQAYEQGAVVLYGRCDEDLGAPYQPFAEALRTLVPCVGTSRLRGLRGVEALLSLVPGLTDVVPDLAAPTRADPDTERYALFDAVVALLEMASTEAPVVLVLDDLHWAAKPTLLLLRHVLRFGDRARLEIVGTYRSTDLDRSHPLAAMLADLHRDGTASRISLSGLDEDDVSAYVAKAGYDDEELGPALASVTGGNPFFLIEALRHVDESGGVWDPSTLPQGVREAVSRRLSRLPIETNKALAAAAVVGSRFALDLVERVVGDDLVDAFDEASKAGIVIEEPGGRYRFNHAIVRQSLLAELPSMRRMRLHHRIATTLEEEPGADDELLAELAHHYFECAWAGNAAKAVEYCRRAADQAMTRLAYEGAADLYDHALHALEELDDELPDRDDQVAELLVARCEALLAAGDVASAAGAVAQLQGATADSARLAAWATCFDGELSVLVHPERLDDVEAALGAAAQKLGGIDDAAGEAKAHTVRATCLARLGRIGECEIALDDALTAARRAREHRRVNAVLASAPLAALWGPNPVPRAGGRCLDVVRLLRITTDSPAVEATSTRCQAVLEAFRGRDAAARRMIDSARRTVTELGLRHALLEVEQFAGIVELVLGDPAAAEPHLRQACNGFRRMGLDADTAETAALLGRTCLLLDRVAEADELCTESERLAGHALKPSIAWRTLRAQLLSTGGDHDEARRVAEAAVALAERTDVLIDHGDACHTLATVLGAAGDAAGARAAAERAVGLYERKGAAALAEKAGGFLRERTVLSPTAPAEAPPVIEPENACVRVIRRAKAVIDREAWDEFERLWAPEAVTGSRRKMVGFTQSDIPDGWLHQARLLLETGEVRLDAVVVIAVLGERLALTRLVLGSADVSPGAPHDELLVLYAVDEYGRIALQTSFDLEDMDGAVAELDSAHARLDAEAHGRKRRPENAASQLYERFKARYAARDWRAVAEMVADNARSEDRRRVVNAGLREGRDAIIAELSGLAETGIDLASAVVATRGASLVLNRVRVWGHDQGPDGFGTVALDVIEIDADEQLVARIVFDFDDFDAAIAELDARYLASEAAAHARTWSVITGGYDALNRHELPLITPDCVNIDHRRETAFGPGDIAEHIHSGLELVQGITIYVEEVHQLNGCGAALTYAAHETSQEGFIAEWRGISLLTVDREMVNRCEVFDEADLDVALARLAELHPSTPRMQNAASQTYQDIWAHFAAREWDAVAGLLADDISTEDRRRVVNAGVRRGRDDHVADMRAIAEVGFENVASTVVANRGSRLTLTRVRTSNHKVEPDDILGEMLCIIETNPEDRITAAVIFDVDDIDAAFEELDARYLAGEAAAHTNTWRVISESYAAINRHERPPTTPELTNVEDRRPIATGPDDLFAYIDAGTARNPNIITYVETVHRLQSVGVVVTYAAQETAQAGLATKWRGVAVSTVEGDLINRSEIFDEANLDAALARFDQLNRPQPRLENTASQIADRVMAHFTNREWDAAAEMLAEDFSSDDRRRTVCAGIRRGRDAAMQDAHANADVGAKEITSTVIATRGERLVLRRARYSSSVQHADAFYVDALVIYEINTDNRIAASVVFDLNDIDDAIKELDARYLAGEAAAHARTWSVIAGGYAALNRRELPSTTPDFVNTDHRRGAAFASGDLIEYLRAGWDLDQDVHPYVETVHRLSDLGGVVTHAAYGVSHEGFDAEWREVGLFTTDGDMFNRCELFDEADLDAALARFEQLTREARQLENAASRVDKRFQACFAAQDWDVMAEMLSGDFAIEDRRRVVNVGNLDGRDAELTVHAYAAVGTENVKSTVLATRAQRLVLTHYRFSGRDHRPDAFLVEMLAVVEIDADERMAAVVVFDADDIDAAVTELDARYLTGEASARADTWSAIAEVFAALNRGELPTTAPDFVDIDHRSLAAIAPGDLKAYLESALYDAPRPSIYIETVHRLTDLGAVTTHVAKATTQEGFDAEWRVTSFFLVGGNQVNRYEIFDDADLEAAIAGFEELSRPAPDLENAAAQAYERLQACFAARDWDAMAEALGGEVFRDDRRRLVGAELRKGRDSVVAEFSALAEIGVKRMTSDTIAIRGSRLVLSRSRALGRDPRADAFRTEVLSIAEIDADERTTALITFDPDHLDAAIAELDARYLAGEAAPYSAVWSAVMQGYVALNRHELPLMTPDVVSIDHRRGRGFAPGDPPAYLLASWELMPQSPLYITDVNRLNDVGAVVTHVVHATTAEGFEAEWREITIIKAAGDHMSRCEIFDEEDLVAALARFEDLEPRSRRLEHPVQERFLAHFAAHDWEAVGQDFADDYYCDDRRRVVNAGVRRGRDAAIEDLRVGAEIGLLTHITSDIIATRGDRLLLIRARGTGPNRRPEDFYTEMLNVVEIDAEARIAAQVMFDPNDIDEMDAAIAELDARYVAGAPAAHARTWSLVADAFVAINRHEFPALTPDWANIDHRRGAAFATGEMTAYIRELWTDAPDINIYVEAVHCLTDLGAVISQAAHGTSQHGFEAEWRENAVFTFDGDLLSRCELFDQRDLDAALARFEELRPRTPRLGNAATRAYEQMLTHYATRDWTAITQIVSDDLHGDDRRSAVGEGIRHGRDSLIDDLRTVADVGVTHATSDTVATRGGRLAVTRARYSRSHDEPKTFYVDYLQLVEIDANKRITTLAAFDADDIDAAIAELDARYLAGEATAHADVWSTIARAYQSITRHELPPTTPNWVNVDHRRGIAFAPGDLTAYLRDMWDEECVTSFIEAVHRLNNRGAIFAQVVKGTSREGFDAEWRIVELMTVEGDLVSRAEIFDEADLDTALARFDELHPVVSRLENAATKVDQRFWSHFPARDWDAMARLLADDISTEDRRRVVNAGVRHGRHDHIAEMRAVAEVGTENVAVTVMAIRGARLALTRICGSNSGTGAGELSAEVLNIIEIDAENRISARVGFDVDNIDAAFAELDARYLGGEAAVYAHAWSVIARFNAAFNRHEIPATDWVTIDHRRLITSDTSDQSALIREVWNITPDLSLHIEAVHRLSTLGAVVTRELHGTSQEGFDAEWRMIQLLTVEGDRVDRSELFDETDLDAALARFDELQLQAPRLENAASQVTERYFKHFSARDWDAMAELVARDISTSDRRRVVNVGAREGRDEHMADMRSIAEVLPDGHITSAVLATRGARLVLTRICILSREMDLHEVITEVLRIDEIDADNRIVSGIAFDIDDSDAAFEELDARYLAGEAAAHAHTWSVIAQGNAAANRNETLPMTPDASMIDHRLRTTLNADGLNAYVRASWDLTPDLYTLIESVHRLSDFGVVVTQASRGTSHDDFEAEWRQITLFTVEGDLCNRCEIFDEANLEAALARFDELQPRAPRLENAASQVYERFQAHFATSDWDSIADMLTLDLYSDDRRPVVGGGIRPGRDALIEDLRAVTTVEITNATSDAVATRGRRLALARARYSRGHAEPDAFHVDYLQLVEVDAEDRITAFIAFDANDIDAATAELDARYVAGEAAAYAHTWSVIAGNYAAMNRHEHFATTPDWINIDHRRPGVIEEGGLNASLGSLWELEPDINFRVEAVYRLSALGAVCLHAAHGVSEEGFDAEWRGVELLTVDGHRISRCEIFDEADLDTALAKFDELSQPTPRLENRATRVSDRYAEKQMARDWDAMSEMLADDFYSDDRRHVVGAGVQHGRDAHIVNARVSADVGVADITTTPVATRGEHLALTRFRYSGRDQGLETFVVELLVVGEIDADGRGAAAVAFDANDVDAAIAELDARYLAGEAAVHSHTWSVIAKSYAATNRHELPPTTPDWENVDHRRIIGFRPGDLEGYLRETFDNLLPDIHVYVEVVHRLSNIGAVVTRFGRGTSPEGFEAEWREIGISTVRGDLIMRSEIFDEVDLDAALDRFDELRPQAPRLENAASQIGERFLTRFVACDWEGMAELLDDDYSSDDRRRVVGAGVRRGRDAQIANLRVIADLWITNLNVTVIATRGERLVLTRSVYSDRDQGSEAFLTDVLDVAEINADERYLANVSFELDDLDAAFAELDARYLAGEAADHAHTWSVIVENYAAFNRHELPAANWVTVDHRPLGTSDTSEIPALTRAVWDLTPDLSICIEAVHRLSSFGAVITHEGKGTSREGFDAEWRMIQIVTVETDRVDRLELFDEADLDAALARFDELERSATP